jgi:hypothetical protein
VPVAQPGRRFLDRLANRPQEFVVVEGLELGDRIHPTGDPLEGVDEDVARTNAALPKTSRRLNAQPGPGGRGDEHSTTASPTVG